MAYNKANYKKRVKKIMAVYNEYKDQNLTDTYIVRVLFPKHDILLGKFIKV